MRGLQAKKREADPETTRAKARTASVESILSVNIARSGTTPAVTVADASDCIVLGDFNLDYKTGTSGAAKTFTSYNKGFQELNKDGKTSTKPLFKKGSKTPGRPGQPQL